MFVRIELALEGASTMEWGYRATHSFVPMVGDIMHLGLEYPDEEPSGNMQIACVVQRREMYLCDAESDGMDVFLTVSQTDPPIAIPEGMIPDSPEWPSREESARKENLRVWLENFHKEHSQ